MSVIEINGITKDYGKNRGVFDLDFKVEQGEVMGFLGPNGAGKTTTIRQLMGFIHPDKGSVYIDAKDCFSQAHDIAGSLGYLPGEIAFIDSMSGMEFIRFVAKVKKMNGLGRAEELMKQFDLNASGKIRKMSKGMKQKIGIVCAFMQDPDILILDEPTSGLDPLMQNQFVELILEEKKRGKTILMSSHIFEEVEKTCDRAAIIKDGRLVAVENVEKMRSNKARTMEVRFADSKTAETFADLFPRTDRSGSSVSVHLKGNMDAFIKSVSKYHVVDMNIRSQSLEELFLHFYGGEEDDKRDTI